MKKFISNNFPVILLLSLILLTVLVINHNGIIKHKLEEKESLINSLQDTLKVVRNKDSSLTATISTLETENASQFLKLVSRDLDVLQLQELVKKYKSKLKEPGSSATKLITDTKVDTKSPTEVVIRDTVRGNDSMIYLYPTYKTAFNLGEWVTGYVKADRDTTEVDILIKNDYDVVIGTEGKWFKRKKSFVEVISHNPYSDVKTLRTYRVSQPKPKKYGLGIQAGYGVTLNSNSILTPYVGVGISYNLIRF